MTDICGSIKKKMMLCTLFLQYMLESSEICVKSKYYRVSGSFLGLKVYLVFHDYASEIVEKLCIEYAFVGEWNNCVKASAVICG